MNIRFSHMTAQEMMDKKVYHYYYVSPLFLALPIFILLVGCSIWIMNDSEPKQGQIIVEKGNEETLNNIHE